MHDIRLIREDPAAFDAGLARRGLEPVAAELIAIDEHRRALATAMQTDQARRNEASREIGAAKRVGDDATAAPLVAEVAAIKERLAKTEAEHDAAAAELRLQLSLLPNIPLADVPDGTGEDGNLLIHARGEIRDLGFAARTHDEIGTALGLDFETGAAMSGARFTLIRGPAARLHRALGQYMLHTLTQRHGYEECVPPLLVREQALFGTGQLPKFAEDLFRAGDEHWLIPTAEVSLTNIVAGRILNEVELPLRLTALTPCFRSEAGAAGRDTRGLIRQHQFEKVEMVSIVTADEPEEELERMTRCAEGMLMALGLPYRRMALCTGDMGFTAELTYDLEVWMPGQDRYREISSCSTCGEFQARRMNARYRAADGIRHVHTLTGSGLAVGRTLAAILENHQRADGTVSVPDVLVPYLGGTTMLKPA